MNNDVESLLFFQLEKCLILTIFSTVSEADNTKPLKSLKNNNFDNILNILSILDQTKL